MPNRLAELDFPDRVGSRLPLPVSQALVGIGCTAASFGTRALLDLLLPGAGPFALIFPFVLIATLVGRWQAGVLTMILSALFAWYFVLPVHGSFRLIVDGDGPRMIVNVLSGFAIVALAEIFRRAVRRAVEQREADVAERDLYLREFDHRVRNNFAQVTAMLDMQRRQMEPGPAQEALSEALGRVDSIARAHRALYRGDGTPGRVEMADYMNELCEALRTGLLERRSIELLLTVEPMRLERDRAVALGLLVNELVTNAAKHAFPGRESGKVQVELTRTKDALCLAVQDDGVGLPAEQPKPSSLGQRLIRAFAAQAGGTLESKSTSGGACFLCTLERREGE